MSSEFAVDISNAEVVSVDSDPAAADLKRRTAHSALVSIVGQGVNFVVRTASMIVMAHLLIPKDFGVFGMVAAITGFLGLFRDMGLSTATVQRASLTEAQSSTIFWINLAFGAALSLICVLLAPALVIFYKDSRLLWVTIALGTSFLVSAAAAQHRAILQRRMRFLALTIIDTVSLFSSLLVGIVLALLHAHHWALVAASIVQSVVSSVGIWMAAKWVPQWPRRNSGVWSMLVYGGTLTLNSVVMYFAYNVDKILLGKFCGPDALGIYGRAYQLINIPTDNLHSAVGQVAIPALSKIQNDPDRLRRYFLRGYGLFLSLVIPITAACGLFPEDIIRVFLGPKWQAAGPIFRLMAPTIMVFALINPMSWLMLASGLARRSLNMSFVIGPVVVVGYVLGVAYGPQGVAAGFSISMLLLLVPVLWWARVGTLITLLEMFKVVLKPVCAALIGGAVVLCLQSSFALIGNSFLRLVVRSFMLFSAYAVVLLWCFGQWSVYIGLLHELGFWPRGERGRTR